MKKRIKEGKITLDYIPSEIKEEKKGKDYVYSREYVVSINANKPQNIKVILKGKKLEKKKWEFLFTTDMAKILSLISLNLSRFEEDLKEEEENFQLKAR